MSKVKLITIMWCLNCLFWVIAGLASNYGQHYGLWWKDFAILSLVSFTLSKLVLSFVLIIVYFPSNEEKDDSNLN